MKIAVISDLHLGFKQYGSTEREEDFYNQLYKVRDEINKYEPNIVIIAGDLFNKPNPTPMAIKAYREGVGNLRADMICTIKGNHTMVFRKNHYSIDEFFGTDEFEGYYYLDDSSTSTYDFALESSYDKDQRYHKGQNVQIDGITYRNNSTINEFIEKQKEMAEKVRGDYNILVVHQSFKEYCGFTGEELSLEDINYSPYDVIICGHIHSRVDVRLSDGTWFIQPGSIERMNTTEALDEEKRGKGFYLIDTEENSVEFHQVECDRKFFLGNVEITSEENLQKHLDELNETIKKLKVQPIISYNYINSTKNIEAIRDKIGQINENILLNKSNIDDVTENEILLEIDESEVPSVIELIKQACKNLGLTKKEIGLAIDIYNTDKKKGLKGIIDDYFEKNKKIEFKEEEIEVDKELESLIEYFKE